MESRITAGQLRAQAISALRRARAMPVGPYRNDLRQIAVGLLWLERRLLAGDPDPFSIVYRDRGHSGVTLGQSEEL